MTSRKSSNSLASGIGPLDRQAGGITARSCQTRDEAAANRVPYIREHDRDDRCRLLRRKNIFGPSGNNNIYFLLHELGNDLGGALAAALCPAKLDRDRTTFDPAEFSQSLHKSFGPSNLHRRRDCAQEANRRQLDRLLRLRPERPHRCAAAEKRDEFTSFHSITSSARASSVGGTSRPSALAVLRLITSSYFVGACTGRSAGFSPLKMRSTYSAARR